MRRANCKLRTGGFGLKLDKLLIATAIQSQRLLRANLQLAFLRQRSTISSRVIRENGKGEKGKARRRRQQMPESLLGRPFPFFQFSFSPSYTELVASCD